MVLTGFTGFLGAHILDSFIKKETGTVYCLIRSKNNMSAEERLLNVLHFYFEDKYDKFVGNRIQVIEGDISFDNFLQYAADLILKDHNITFSSPLARNIPYRTVNMGQNIEVKGIHRFVQQVEIKTDIFIQFLS